MAKPALSVPELLKSAPAAVRPTLEATRRLVLDVAPEATEIAYDMKPPSSPSTMWKLARYAINGRNVVGIGTFPNHSSLYFYRGRELDDGSGLLQGGGKDMRFITLRTPQDVTRPDVKRVVQKAFEHAET